MSNRQQRIRRRANKRRNALLAEFHARAKVLGYVCMEYDFGHQLGVAGSAIDAQGERARFAYRGAVPRRWKTKPTRALFARLVAACDRWKTRISSK